MDAALDIGNTRSKCALFDGDDIRVVLLDRNVSALTESIEKYEIRRLIVSTVAGDWVDEEAAVRALDFFLNLDHHTPLPITIDYETPETLGNDRVAACVGAAYTYPKQNNLVIDIGTCITLDVISADGTFLGGNIAPGVELRYRAMDEFTANLPLARREDANAGSLGKSTKGALALGGLIGVESELDGFISRLEGEIGNLNIILTGGDAAYFGNHLKSKIFVHPNLVLTGLGEILKFNVEQK